jgi:hypothetical protein
VKKNYANLRFSDDELEDTFWVMEPLSFIMNVCISVAVVVAVVLELTGVMRDEGKESVALCVCETHSHGRGNEETP